MFINKEEVELETNQQQLLPDEIINKIIELSWNSIDYCTCILPTFNTPTPSSLSLSTTTNKEKNKNKSKSTSFSCTSSDHDYNDPYTRIHVVNQEKQYRVTCPLHSLYSDAYYYNYRSDLNREKILRYNNHIDDFYSYFGVHRDKARWRLELGTTSKQVFAFIQSNLLTRVSFMAATEDKTIQDHLRSNYCALSHISSLTMRSIQEFNRVFGIPYETAKRTKQKIPCFPSTLLQKVDKLILIEESKPSIPKTHITTMLNNKVTRLVFSGTVGVNTELIALTRSFTHLTSINLLGVNKVESDSVISSWIKSLGRLRKLLLPASHVNCIHDLQDSVKQSLKVITLPQMNKLEKFASLEHVFVFVGKKDCNSSSLLLPTATIKRVTFCLNGCQPIPNKWLSNNPNIQVVRIKSLDSIDYFIPIELELECWELLSVRICTCRRELDWGEQERNLSFLGILGEYNSQCRNCPEHRYNHIDASKIKKTQLELGLINHQIRSYLLYKANVTHSITLYENSPIDKLVALVGKDSFINNITGLNVRFNNNYSIPSSYLQKMFHHLMDRVTHFKGSNFPFIKDINNTKIVPPPLTHMKIEESIATYLTPSFFQFTLVTSLNLSGSKINMTPEFPPSLIDSSFPHLKKLLFHPNNIDLYDRIPSTLQNRLVTVSWTHDSTGLDSQTNVLGKFALLKTVYMLYWRSRVPPFPSNVEKLVFPKNLVYNYTVNHILLNSPSIKTIKRVYQSGSTLQNCLESISETPYKSNLQTLIATFYSDYQIPIVSPPLQTFKPKLSQDHPFEYYACIRNPCNNKSNSKIRHCCYDD
ncbi:hypothetical protein DFA_10521 [Cavenderia fasciculata]|uniref:Uncharacterized protein n=1 Tax=Cavenderia fasciculata TaxID=261658 RepID=F4QAG0_CACFS|nr:uncharacterized protein DFA_10521 [Cavenderia fasciculata]EGG15679.1 hypothetical protein DFA_10521 [Cavenderia fasciculata]|eukprot:XP_004354421.1 hypothetical protein DFA_10521 [Cavenderia fasciculata]